MSEKRKFTVLFTGGGTGGSVTPLLAIYEQLKENGAETGKKELEFLWLGTGAGPERQMVASASSVRGAEIEFKAISWGKWRRYFSWKNLTDLFNIKLGFWQAFFIILKRRPDLVISAGSFVSVPVIWAAWCLRVPAIVHQQDVIPGLANKLMAPFARVITVTFEQSLADFGKKAVWTGNPTRQSLEIKNQKSNIKINEMPVVLILGGGTGAEAINGLVWESLEELTEFCQVIHTVGRGKNIKHQVPSIKNYFQYDFLDAEQIAEAMRAADLVVTRAGLGTLSELSYLGKPAIIIPMPDSHQEANAEYFGDKQAALVVSQNSLTAADLAHLIRNLLADRARRLKLGEKMKEVMKQGANQEMEKIIFKIRN